MRYVLDGHVKVKWNDRIITADHAQVSIPSLEVWAQGNIELHQDDIYFRGDDLHVLGSSDTANITGNARFERDELKISADKACSTTSCQRNSRRKNNSNRNIALMI